MLRTNPYLKLLDKNPKMICGFGGAGDGREGRSGGRGAGPGLAGGGPDSGREPGATAVRRGVPPVPRQRRL